MRYVGGEGPIPTKVMIVGEMLGREEEFKGRPFVGGSGHELDRMLHDAGLQRHACYLTNVVRFRSPTDKPEYFFPAKKKDLTAEHIQFRGRGCLPVVREHYDHLRREIKEVKPNVIVAAGNVALWALTGLWGITKWRGSELRVDFDPAGPKVIPTYNPAAILHQWAWRAASVSDLRRAARNQHELEYPPSDWSFTIRPSFEQVVWRLSDLLQRCDAAPTKLVFDLETRAGHIACAGIAWSKREAICIPFMCVENREGYWLEEQEAQIVYLLWQLLTHSNARVVGQNLLYDFQYTWRWWRFAPRLWHDTMVRQHVAFCEQPKALDFQASIYCERYRYWKDDGKEWTKGMGEEVLWSYNCEDCVRTWEVDEVHDQTIPALRMEEIDLFQHKLFWSAFETMVRGKKRDEAKREEYAARLLEELEKRERDLAFVLEHPLNPRSPVQMHKLFYEDLRQPVHRNAKTKMPSLDDDALDAIKRRQPLLRPLIRRISEHRSIGVFIGTFINAKLDRDGRFRSSLNICGTGTYRLSSSKNAFGSGGNEQNIPGRAHPEDDSYLELPNIRELFIPDPNHTWFDLDLDRADLQIVVWEAEDEALKKALRAGVDMHLYNVRDVYGIDIPDDEIVESHPKCKEHKERYYAKRHACKAGVHATNYYCQPRKLALVLNCTVHEAEHFQRRWFGAHPGVLSWHRRVENDLLTKRQVRNAFGYVWRVFSRPDSVLPEALAWIPQSTVARVINEIWTRLDDTRTAEVLAQVHDSLAGQFPTADKPARIARIKELSKVVIPYPDPLVIGTGIKTSEISWGAC